MYVYLEFYHVYSFTCYKTPRELFCILQIRGREELLPIAEDKNMVFDFQDYRRLSTPVKSLPGDRLIAQCIYDSTSRQALTLGKCVILQLYTIHGI